MDTRTVQTGKTGFSVCGFTTRSFEEGFFLRSFPDTAGVFPKERAQKNFGLATEWEESTKGEWGKHKRIRKAP